MGHKLFRSFNSLIRLTEVKRQDKTTQGRFVELLSHFRNGCLPPDDLKYLNERCIENLDTLPANIDDMTSLYGTNKEALMHNIKKLKQLGNPIAKVKAIHSDNIAERAKPEVAWGLRSVIYLARGAKVMLGMNLMQKYGLVNGSKGWIKDIVYRKGTGPTSVPELVIIHFQTIKGLKCLKILNTKIGCL